MVCCGWLLLVVVRCCLLLFVVRCCLLSAAISYCVLLFVAVFVVPCSLYVFFSLGVGCCLLFGV